MNGYDYVCRDVDSACATHTARGLLSVATFFNKCKNIQSMTRYSIFT